MELSTAAKGMKWVLSRHLLLSHSLFLHPSTSPIPASLILNQTFEADYPKLVKTFTELLSQIDHIQSHREGSDPSLRPKPESRSASKQREDQLLQSLAQFEKPYISRSFGRLSDTVNQLFSTPSRGLPREDEILSLVKLIAR